MGGHLRGFIIWLAKITGKIKDNFLEAIMSKVTGKQITAVVVFWLLLYFTSDGVKHYLDRQYEQQYNELILQVIREVKDQGLMSS